MEDPVDLGEGEIVRDRGSDRERRVREELISTGVEDGDQRIDPGHISRGSCRLPPTWTRGTTSVAGAVDNGGAEPARQGGRRLSSQAACVGEDGRGGVATVSP